MDPLADLFRMLSLRGAVYFAQHFAAPWGLKIPQRPHAQFHVVLSGHCYVEAGKRHIALHERDVILFPGGLPHVISDGSGAGVLDGQSVVRAVVAGKSPFQHGEVSVRLLSGHFAFDSGARHPLIAELPEVIHTALGGVVDIALFTALFPVLTSEQARNSPVTETIVERLCEIFLIQVLRAHFADAGSKPSLMQAIFDPKLSRAMNMIQGQWQQRLTVNQLARAAGMSRSVFSQRFSAAARVTPMAYLAHWRLLQARRLLQTTELSIAEIAAISGHGSPESFSRSFKQLYGISPKYVRTSQP